ncbi:MAG: phage protein [Motiliproteus sp.]
MKRINGKSFDFDLSGLAIHANKMTLDITDNTAVSKTKGVPDGYTDGDVEAAGEIEVDRSNMKLITEAARKAGSFRGLELFDITSFAQAGDDELKVEAFGCKLMVSSALDVDPNSADKSVFKLPYVITSPDFVRIDGVPYLAPEEIAGLS